MGGPGPLQQLNQQYVAWQFNFLRSGNNANAAKASNAQCYGLEFAPFTLTNLETISVITPLGTIEAQVRLALQQNRVDDYIPLAEVMKLFNGTNPVDTCFKPGGIGSPFSSSGIAGDNETPRHSETPGEVGRRRGRGGSGVGLRSSSLSLWFVVRLRRAS